MSMILSIENILIGGMERLQELASSISSDHLLGQAAEFLIFAAGNVLWFFEILLHMAFA